MIKERNNFFPNKKELFKRAFAKIQRNEIQVLSYLKNKSSEFSIKKIYKYIPKFIIDEKLNPVEKMVMAQLLMDYLGFEMNQKVYFRSLYNMFRDIRSVITREKGGELIRKENQKDNLLKYKEIVLQDLEDHAKYSLIEHFNRVPKLDIDNKNYIYNKRQKKLYFINKKQKFICAIKNNNSLL